MQQVSRVLSSTRRQRRWFPVFNMLAVVALLGWHANPGQASNIVERWKGTIHASYRADTTKTFTAVIYYGLLLEQYDLRYDIKVDDTGYASGDVGLTLNSYSIRLTDNRSCLATGLRDCSVTTSVTQPKGSFFVEGKRFATTDGQPRLKLDKQIDISHPQTSTTTCGKVAPLYTAFYCLPGDPVDDVLPELPVDFVITPYQYGRPPLANPAVSNFDDPSVGISQIYQGDLTGVGQEPTVDLQTELLERSRFFTQVPVDDRLDGTLDWNSPDGGYLTWKVADDAPDRQGPTRDVRTAKTKDVGFSTPGTKPVEIQAHNIIGKDSRPATTNLTAIQWPLSAKSPANVAAKKDGDVVTYKLDLRFPNPPFKAQIDQVPEGVPFFGGCPAGIEDTQVGIGVEMKSTGEGYAKGDAKATLNGICSTVKGSISGKSTVQLSDQCGIEYPSGEIELKVSSPLKNKEPLLALIPALTEPVLTLQKISPAAYYAINKLNVSAEIEPHIDLKLKTQDVKCDLGFKSGEGKIGLAMRVNLVLEVVKDTLVATVGVGGDLSQGVQVPAPYLKDSELKLLATAKLTLGNFYFERERAVKCTRSGAGFVCDLGSNATSPPGLGATDLATATWQATRPDWRSDPRYGQATTTLTPTTTTTGVDQQLVAGVMPQANPAIAIVPDTTYGASNTLLAWTYDRPTLPYTSSKEIEFAQRDNNGNWSDPVILTNDNHDDWNPRVAFTPNHYQVLVWQRMDTATPPNINDDFAGYLSHMQIVAGQPNSNNTPVTPQQLSVSGGGISYRPQLATTDTGTIATWINNPSNQIGGDTTHPDTIMFSRFDESKQTWSAASSAVGPIAGLVDYQMATTGLTANGTPGPNAVIVFSRDMDGNRDTTGDQEIFYSRWLNGAWSPAAPLTANTVADTSPQVALLPDANPVFVWNQNGQLVYQVGATGTARPIILPDATNRTDYRLITAADGTLALVWQQMAGDATRIGYALYDAPHDRWSDERTITPPVSPTATGSTIASAMAPALVTGTNGYHKDRLIVAYQLGETASVTNTINGVVYPNTQQVGNQSLHVVDERVGTNLTIHDSDLSVTPETATPGQTVQLQAAVHNTGQFAVNNVPVVLSTLPTDASFDQFATPIMTQTLPLLAAGDTYTVTFPVQRPALAQNWYVSVPVVDGPCPPNQCYMPPALENDYTDNHAMLTSQLAIDTRPTEYTPLGISVVARVTQTGGLYTTSPTSATLRLGAPDGPKVGDAAVAFPMTPTSQLTVSSLISPTMLGLGSHQLYWQLDPGQRLGQSDRSGTEVALDVDVLPDLATDAAWIGWDTAPGTAPGFSMRVENRGSWASPATVAAVWDSDPTVAGAHLLGRIPIPAIDPGRNQEINGTLNLAGLPSATTGLKSVYVQLDPDHAVAETNENNNLVVVGGPLGGPYPAVSRNVFVPLVRR